MRIVISGGAGFIGANLCRAALASTAIDEVVVLDDLSTGRLANLEGIDVEVVVGSILDDDVLRSTVHGADAIVHLGARPSVPRSIDDPVSSHEANATGTMRVLEAARGAGGVHVVVASSSSVYGANPELPKHEGLATRPRSPYAASKLAAEAYALAWQDSYGLPVLALRFFNVFGPLQPADHAYAAVVPMFIDAALAGRPAVIHGDGMQSRDFTFVDTLTEVLCQAVERRVTSDEPVNLAFGTRTDLLDVLGRLEGLVGHPIEREHVEARVGDVRHSQADSSRLTALFPDVRPTSLDDGLAATVEWFRSTGAGG